MPLPAIAVPITDTWFVKPGQLTLTQPLMVTHCPCRTFVAAGTDIGAPVSQLTSDGTPDKLTDKSA
jgi:hypothetical protein